MAPGFSLSIHAFTPPNLPVQPADLTASDVRSPLLASPVAATSPLSFTLALDGASRATDPLYPATHLQLAYHWEGTGDTFVPRTITSEDLTAVEEEGDGQQQTSGLLLFSVQVPPGEIPRAKVNEGTTNTAEVRLYAWRGERLLGTWVVGCVEGLGLVGMKSTPLALLRQKTREAQGKAQ